METLFLGNIEQAPLTKSLTVRTEITECKIKKKQIGYVFNLKHLNICFVLFVTSFFHYSYAETDTNTDIKTRDKNESSSEMKKSVPIDRWSQYYNCRVSADFDEVFLPNISTGLPS